MRRTSLNVLISIFSTLVLFSQAYSAPEITRKIELKEHQSHLLTFDEKILRYKASENGVFDIEILPDIYNTRHEMLVRPIKAANSHLVIWTQNKTYNFTVKTRGKSRHMEDFDILEIDLPPGLN